MRLSLLTYLSEDQVEIISRVLRSNESWQKIRNIWKTIYSEFEVRTNPSCGTHVHISNDGDFDDRELKLVAASALL